MRNVKYAFGLSLILAVIGCGGGSSGSSSVTGALTGAFIDAPVEGLYYETTSGVTGLTDSSGQFKFNAGDAVTFKIGGAQGLELASATPTASDKAQIKATELDGGAQIAQILQSFSTSTDPDKKLDLSKVVFTDAHKATIKDHITKRGDLDAFATAAAAIVSDVSSKVGVTLVAKTKADVESHLTKAEKNFPTTTMPAIDNRTFFAVDTKSDKLPIIFGVKKGVAKVLTEYLEVVEGTYTVNSGTSGEFNFTSITENGSTTKQAFSCKFGLTFKEKLALSKGIEGFVVTTKEEAACNDGVASEGELEVYPVDSNFGISSLSGKTLVLSDLKNNGETPCGEISLKFSEGTSDLSVTATYDNTSICSKAFKFPSDTKLSLLTADSSNLLTIKVDYGSGYKGAFIFGKSLGVSPKIGLIFASNFNPEVEPSPLNASDAKWIMRRAQAVSYSIK